MDEAVTDGDGRITPGGGARPSRRALWRAALGGLSVGLVALLVMGTLRIGYDTSIASFVPDDAVSTEGWQRAQASFGGDPLLVVVEADQDLALVAPTGIANLLRLEGRLAALPDAAAVYGPGTTVNQIAGTAQRFLATLAGRRDARLEQLEGEFREDGGSDEEAAQLAAEAIEEFDARYGGLIAEAAPVGLPTLRNPDFAPGILLDAEQRPRARYRWLLPTERHAAIVVRPREQLSQAHLSALAADVEVLADTFTEEIEGARATVAGAPLVSDSLAAQARRELLSLGAVALISAAAVLLLLHRSPWRRRLLPLAIAVGATGAVLATFGWTDTPVSLGLLTLLPIVIAIGTDLPIYAARGGGTRHIVAAALATATGFSVLALSPLPFVRTLGLTVAVGVVLAAVLGLWVARRGTPPAEARADEAVGGATVSPERAAGTGPVSGSGRTVSRWVVAVAVTTIVATSAVGWSQLGQLEVESDPRQLAGGTPALAAAEEAEQVLGVSGEVVVHVEADDVLTPAHLAWYEAAEDLIISRYGDRLRRALSPTQVFGFLGDSPTATQIAAATDLVPGFLLSGTLNEDRTAAAMVYGLALGDLGTQAEVLRSLDALLPPPPPGTQVNLVGLPVQAAAGYGALVSGRTWLNVIGLLATCLALGLALRSWRSGLLALASSTTAFGWGVGVLALIDAPLTPLTVAFGSFVAAVGGEYAVMASSRPAGRGRWSPVHTAAATSVAGFSALLWSQLSVVRGFGIVLIASVVLSLIAARCWVLLVGSSEPRQRAVYSPAGAPEEVLV